MTTAFWDSSALAPLCISVQATARHRRYARTTAIVAWWATRLEIQGAIERCSRDGVLDGAQRSQALWRMAALAESWREILPTEAVRGLAAGQLERFPLRAADALQLGAALAWCREQPRHRSFLTADRSLAAAAADCGFDVIVP